MESCIPYVTAKFIKRWKCEGTFQLYSGKKFGIVSAKYTEYLLLSILSNVDSMGIEMQVS